MSARVSLCFFTFVLPDGQATTVRRTVGKPQLQSVQQSQYQLGVTVPQGLNYHTSVSRRVFVLNNHKFCNVTLCLRVGPYVAYLCGTVWVWNVETNHSKPTVSRLQIWHVCVAYSLKLTILFLDNGFVKVISVASGFSC